MHAPILMPGKRYAGSKRSENLSSVLNYRKQIFLLSLTGIPREPFLMLDHAQYVIHLSLRVFDSRKLSNISKDIGPYLYVTFIDNCAFKHTVYVTCTMLETTYA